MPRIVAPLAAAVILLAGLASVQPPVHAEAASPGEVRGLWVVRTALTSPGSIDRMVAGAEAAGFNTLLVQVRGRGDAYYLDALEPRPPALGADPRFDPLATTLTKAHARGLRVLAWINVNLVSSAHDLPADPGHIVNRAPEWLMVPRGLAQELSVASPSSPGFVGRLARWARSNATSEGLYASPLHPGAADHAVQVAGDLARRYAIDGVHFDYLRYPGAEFDYSRAALDGFRAAVRADVSPATARTLDARRVDDVLAWVDAMPERWEEFRRARLTALTHRLRDAVVTARPGALVTAAVVADHDEARRVKMQDWRRWLDLGLLDVACPMAYTPDDDVFERQIASAAGATTTGAIWAGIGAYRLTPDQTVARIATARRAGAEGVVLFSYDSLVEASPATYLTDVGRSAFPETRGTSGGR